MGEEEYATRRELQETTRELTSALRADIQRLYDRLGDVIESNHQVSTSCALNDAAVAALHRRLDESDTERHRQSERLKELDERMDKTTTRLAWIAGALAAIWAAVKTFPQILGGGQ